MSIFNIFKKTKTSGTAMIIDIREDVPDFLAYIRQRVEQHMASSQPSELVGVITFGFEIGQGNMAWLDFDTRSNAAPDGKWTVRVGKTPRLDRPKWPVFYKIPKGKPVFFIDLQGRKVEVLCAENTDELVAAIVGDAMKQALLKARAEGFFNLLPKVPKCPMFVEHMERFYSWPTCNDHSGENLL